MHCVNLLLLLGDDMARELHVLRIGTGGELDTSHVDGALVGGASLDAQAFLAIIDAAAAAKAE